MPINGSNDAVRLHVSVSEFTAIIEPFAHDVAVEAANSGEALNGQFIAELVTAAYEKGARDEARAARAAGDEGKLN